MDIEDPWIVLRLSPNTGGRGEGGGGVGMWKEEVNFFFFFFFPKEVDNRIESKVTLWLLGEGKF